MKIITGIIALIIMVLAFSVSVLIMLAFPVVLGVLAGLLIAFNALLLYSGWRRAKNKINNEWEGKCSGNEKEQSV